MSVTTFEEFWQNHEDQVLEAFDGNEEQVTIVKMLCDNAWLQSDVLRRQQMLGMAQSFHSERELSQKIMSGINETLDALIAGIARKLECNGDNQPRNNDGSGQ